MRSILLAAAVAMLTACASGGGSKPAPGAPGVDALYTQIDGASRRYRDALAQVARGDVETGRSALTKAGAELLDAATRCQQTSGCDMQRAIAAYDALLARRAQGGEEGFAELEDDPALAGESPIVADLPAAGRSVALLKGRDLRELIVLNEPMKAALTEWLTSLRPHLIDTWENYQHMRALMWPEYRRAGLPEALLFGILAKESGGKVHAVSRAGASGPLQFMPATGRRFGLGNYNGFDTRFDPQLSARANVGYLNERFAELNNNLELSLAAYNGGEGRIRRIAGENPGRGFWDPRLYAQLPPETRDYVPMVIAAAWLYLNAGDYGLQWPRVNAGEPQQVSMLKPTTLNELALCLGNAGSRDGWFRALRNLNPRYEPITPIYANTVLRMPPRAAALYKANCLEGPRARMAAELALARRPTVIPSALPTRPAALRAAQAGSYTVKRGDTLNAIARRHGCGGVRQLARANGLKAPRYTIAPGQRLRLEGCRN